MNNRDSRDVGVFSVDGVGTYPIQPEPWACRTDR